MELGHWILCFLFKGVNLAWFEVRMCQDTLQGCFQSVEKRHFGENMTTPPHLLQVPIFIYLLHFDGLALINGLAYRISAPAKRKTDTSRLILRPEWLRLLGEKRKEKKNAHKISFKETVTKMKAYKPQCFLTSSSYWYDWSVMFLESVSLCVCICVSVCSVSFLLIPMISI